MISSKNKVLKLENNKEYFALQEVLYNDNKYLLIINVSDENDIKTVQKTVDGEEDYISEIVDDKLLNTLKTKFRDLVEEDIKK